jgi:uncharacterized protein (TIGR02246 family)
MRTQYRSGLLLILAAQSVLVCTTLPGQPKSTEARLRALEDREEIRQLLIDYGRTLDNRDFSAFSKLFTDDAEYIGGGEPAPIQGGAAIARSLESIFQQNPTGVRSPNFHLFANETIQIKGDEAVAVSKGLFVVSSQAGAPEIVMMATYHDILTRDAGRWKFKRRTVRGDIPAPKAQK